MAGHGTSESSDRGIGLATAFALLTGLGAVVTYLNPMDPIAGWGFALAMLAATLAVVAIHLYW